MLSSVLTFRNFINLAWALSDIARDIFTIRLATSFVLISKIPVLTVLSLSSWFIKQHAILLESMNPYVVYCLLPFGGNCREISVIHQIGLGTLWLSIR